jgi:hypothetical protein
MRATTAFLIAKGRVKYSIDSKAADVVAGHPHRFRLGQVVDDPWHYLHVLNLHVLMRNQDALRNGAPFKDWDLPAPLSVMRAPPAPRRRRQLVKILGRVLEDSVAAVAPACAESPRGRNRQSRRRLSEPRPQAATALCTQRHTTPEALKLRTEPTADCAPYDDLRQRREDAKWSNIRSSTQWPA